MIIMAVDLGDARTGIAVCDKLEMLASPVGTITEYNKDKLIDKINDLVTEYNVEELVLGNPVNMDGTEGARAQMYKEFGEKLKNKTGKKVTMWDERATTVSATEILNFTNTRGKKRKAIIDTVSAVLILESYMEFKKRKQ